MIRLFAFNVAIVLAVPALADETAWQDVMPGVQMRLLTSDAITEDRTSWVALEIQMPEDTKTYWRVPGEAGIPTELDFSRSKGISGTSIAWPFPTRKTNDGYLDHAYYGHLVLPIEIEVTGDAVDLVIDATLGMCSDVCVPVHAGFSHQMTFEEPDETSMLRIQQARALVPLQHNGEGMFGEAILETTTGAVRVALEGQFDTSGAIAEIAGSMALFDEPSVSPDGRWLEFEHLGRASSLDLGSKHLHLSFPTPDGPLEVVRPITIR